MVHEIIEQHAEMAGFLWELYGMAAASHHYALSDLRDLEDRIDAHLDGLRIAGEPGWEVAKARLAPDDAGAFFVAAALAMEARDDAGVASMLDAAAGEASAMCGIEGALSWVAPEDALYVVEPVMGADQPPVLLRLALHACAVHRRDPGPLLSYGLFGRDAALRARALRAMGELGRGDLADELRRALGAEGEPGGVRFWAAWSGALLGVRGAPEVLWAIAQESGPFAEAAADVAARSTPHAEARERIEALATWPGAERVSLVAAGALGDPSVLPWVLEKAEVAATSRLAGEVFAGITGARIEGPLRGAPAWGFEPVPTSDPGDDRVAMDPEAHLPWPHGANTRTFYVANRARFTPGVRHSEGRPLEEGVLFDTLRAGKQRRRAGAAFELAARSLLLPLFDVTARASRQASALRAAAGAPT